jgi:hypothetical protein
MSAQTFVEQRRLIAARADHCVRWLKSQGFEVIAVCSGSRIIVRHTPECDALEGAVSGYQRTVRGEIRYRFAIRFDCEIRWSESENQDEYSGSDTSPWGRVALALGFVSAGGAA